MKKHILITLICTGIVSCTQIADLHFDNEKRQIVLNAILDASKDTVWAELSWSKPITDSNDFDIVDHGKIFLYTKDQLIDTFSYFKNGSYFLPYSPCSNEEYTLIAVVDRDTISGSTTVPPFPEITIEQAGGSCDYYLAHIQTNTDVNSAYWISPAILEYKQDTLVQRLNYIGLYANGYLLDDFNRSSDVFCSLPFNYAQYLRILNSTEEHYDTIRFSIGILGNNEKAEIISFSTDSNYDKYIRSSILAGYNEAIITEFPLFSGYVKCYSNIKGGLGLVASINSKTQVFSHE